jgi:hypothetical protein
MLTLSETRPSNFVIFAMVVVAVVLVWFAWLTTHRHRSADQRILVERAHQQQQH